jgi:hypothetical protein
MIELGNEQDIVDLAVLKGGRKFLVASDAGRGFIVPGGRGRGADQERQAGAEPRRQGEGAGLRVVPKAPIRSRAQRGRKLLIFPIDQVPEMGRGRGRHPAEVQGRSAVGRTGLPDRGRACRGPTASSRPGELKFWRGERAQAGRMPKKDGRAPSASRTDRWTLTLIWKTVLIGVVEGPDRIPAGVLDGATSSWPRRSCTSRTAGKVFEIVIQLGAILAGLLPLPQKIWTTGRAC